MKKVLLLSILTICLTGCTTKTNLEDNVTKSGDIIENIAKKDINTIKSTSFVIDENLQYAEIFKDEEGESYVKISDSYVLNEKPNNNLKEHFFENEREILPSKIYLMDTNQKCYYEYDGEIYYIPVEKCNSEDEERIVYQDYGIEVFKKDGVVNIFGEKVNTYDENNASMYAMNEFENYFINNPNGQVWNKIYETDLDGKLETKEISLCYFEIDPGDGIVSKRMVVSKDIDNNIKTYIAPLFICGNVYDYKNVFYITGFSRGYCINDVIEEFLIWNYCIFDNENGFQYVWRFANGDEIKAENFEKLKTYEITLNENITFVSTKGSYYEKRADYTVWRWSMDDNVEEVTLEAGTKLKIVGIIDEYGNSIVMTEDGTRYEIANYAGIVDSENFMQDDETKYENVKKLDESKDIVYTVHEEEFMGDTFKIPFINIDSEDVKNINTEINNQINSYIVKLKKEENNEKYWDGRFSEHFDYVSNVNDNILTVVMIFDDEYNYAIENVYNIDIYTGKQMTSEDVLKANNIDASKIDLKHIYDNVFLEVFDYAIPIYLKDEFIENKKILGDNQVANLVNGNYSAYSEYYEGKTLKDTKYYLDSNKNIIAEIMHMAPAGAIVGTRQTVNVTEILNGKGNNWYMIEDSDKIIISENTNWEDLNDCLNDLSNSELNVAYNEIFARHGHDFSSQNLKEHFSSMIWYKPVDGKVVSIEELNDIEKENIRIIKEEVEKRKVLLQKFKDGEYEGQPT